MPLSAAENVAMFGRRPPDPGRCSTRAAERAGAAEIIASLPHGWDTILSPHYAGGVDLSGGQWQRIALARALYAVETGARVLVLDEPTAQLDIRGEAAFYDRFLELTAGVTSIVISHRFASVRRADRIAVLDGGRISELGTHDELLAAGGTYATMFRAPGRAVRRHEAPRAASRSWRRLAGVLVGPGFGPRRDGARRACHRDRGRRPLGLLQLGFRVMIDGAIAHDSSRIVLGAALVAVPVHGPLDACDHRRQRELDADRRSTSCSACGSRGWRPRCRRSSTSSAPTCSRASSS